MIDCAGLNIGFIELHALWPYIQAAVLEVALKYSGCCKRLFITRPPRLFWWAWRLLQPVLPAVRHAGP